MVCLGRARLGMAGQVRCGRCGPVGFGPAGRQGQVISGAESQLPSSADAEVPSAKGNDLSCFFGEPMLRDCPPIPPNHEFFSVKYQEFNWPDTFHWELTLDIGKQNRSVIAAVARCAWLDEILDDDYDASGGLNEHGLLCQDNANAWRVWGLT